MLNLLYGENEWINPEENNYEFKNQLGEYGMQRNTRELPFMFRFFEQNGNVDVFKTLEKINEYYFPLNGNNLTELPDDHFDFL